MTPTRTPTAGPDTLASSYLARCDQRLRELGDPDGTRSFLAAAAARSGKLALAIQTVDRPTLAHGAAIDDLAIAWSLAYATESIAGRTTGQDDDRMQEVLSLVWGRSATERETLGWVATAVAPSQKPGDSATWSIICLTGDSAQGHQALARWLDGCRFRDITSTDSAAAVPRAGYLAYAVSAQVSTSDARMRIS